MKSSKCLITDPAQSHRDLKDTSAETIQFKQEEKKR